MVVYILVMVYQWQILLSCFSLIYDNIITHSFIIKENNNNDNNDDDDVK
jgi:hypothetical protein